MQCGSSATNPPPSAAPGTPNESSRTASDSGGDIRVDPPAPQEMTCNLENCILESCPCKSAESASGPETSLGQLRPWSVRFLKVVGEVGGETCGRALCLSSGGLIPTSSNDIFAGELVPTVQEFVEGRVYPPPRFETKGSYTPIWLVPEVSALEDQEPLSSSRVAARHPHEYPWQYSGLTNSVLRYTAQHGFQEVIRLQWRSDWALLDHVKGLDKKAFKKSVRDLQNAYIVKQYKTASCVNWGKLTKLQVLAEWDIEEEEKYVAFEVLQYAELHHKGHIVKIVKCNWADSYEHSSNLNRHPITWAIVNNIRRRAINAKRMSCPPEAFADFMDKLNLQRHLLLSRFPFLIKYFL